MAEYEHTPAGEVRRVVADGSFVFPDDPQRIAQAMIDLVDSDEAPLRLPLGSDAYDDARASLVARLAEHEAQRQVVYCVVSDEENRSAS
ncbi:hypothetical protein AB0I22_37940 [Streptomyces sp. NPDC050610]|uniref:hypothetical protein n=1 Tax=Streptomyces sp. NPDC050610 TaxID=3157097 RepID=UPI00344390A7